MSFAKTAIIYPDVFLGADPEIGDYAVIGVLPRGRTYEEHVLTQIGDRAIIRSHTVIYAENIIGHDFQTGHGVLIRETNRIGDNVSIGSHTVVEHHVEIGHRVRIHSQVFIPEFSLLEDECWVGPNVVFTNAKYPLSPEVKKQLKGPTIHSGAKIGANTTLLPGVSIGYNALIGAGTVVVEDVPDRAVVVGNPGRVIKYVDELAVYPPKTE